jgi:hypothetical protein
MTKARRMRLSGHVARMGRGKKGRREREIKERLWVPGWKAKGKETTRRNKT